jgi:3-hydroxyisobutyrate dehydrogenase-like beta-hydroxyacid dehydrogenase
MTSGEGPKEVSILGTGLLGGAIVERLQAKHWRIRAYDPDPAARERLAHIPILWTGGESEALDGACFAVFCFPNSGVAAGLASRLFQPMAPNGIAIDCTTGEPGEMSALAMLAKSLGRCYLDATVGGSSQQTRDGQVLLMAGGEPADLVRAQPLLDALSERVVHVGPSGSGARMKLVLNLALGLHRAVLAESLHLAESLGLDPALALSILREGPAYSRIMDTKGERMLNRDYTPVARLTQHRKDVSLMLGLARELGLDLPLTATHDSLLAAAEAAGYGDADNSAIIEAFRKDA